MSEFDMNIAGTEDVLTAETLIKALEDDRGAHFQPEVLEWARRLYRTDKPGYTRLASSLAEARAPELGDWRKAVKNVGQDEDEDDGAAGRALVLPEPEPWHKAVDGAALLDEIERTFTRFVILPNHAATALALWVAHTYAMEAANAAPRLVVLSPEKRCGKTTLLSVLKRTVYRAMPASNISPAALFRTIEAFQPTLLLDEADTWLRGDADELRGVVNCGHTRDAAFVIRTVGEDHEPRAFSTWAPIVIAAIGKLPGTIEDRSVAIELRRRLPDERVESLRAPGTDLTFEVITRKIRRWVDDHLDVLKAAQPKIPSGLDDRAADNWSPLLTIADAAGGEWPEKARRAAEALSLDRDDEASIRVRLLSDIRTVFADDGRLHTATLIRRLIELEESPWGSVNRGREIDANSLSRLLRPFKIRSVQMKIAGVNKHGYEQKAFGEAWARYVTPPVTTRDPATTGGNPGVSGDATRYPDDAEVAGSSGSKPAEILEGSEVAPCSGRWRGDGSGQASGPWKELV